MNKKIIDYIKNIINNSEMYKLEGILTCDECIEIAELVGANIYE